MKITKSIRFEKELEDYLETRAEKNKISVSKLLNEIICTQVLTARELIRIELDNSAKILEKSMVTEKDLTNLQISINKIINLLERL